MGKYLAYQNVIPNHTYPYPGTIGVLVRSVLRSGTKWYGPVSLTNRFIRMDNDLGNKRYGATLY